MSSRKFTFQYAHWNGATVTVSAKDEATAREKASSEMDRRYEKRGMEPPVAWSLRLIPTPRHQNHQKVKP